MPQDIRDKHIVRKTLLCVAIMLAIFAGLLFVAVEAANAGSRLQDSESFGIGNQRFSVNAQVGVISNGSSFKIDEYDSSSTLLATYSTRDIATALSSISYKVELAAKAAAEAAKAQELIEANFAKNKRNEHAIRYGMPPGLEEVDGDMSKDAFIAEGAMRINRYFLGTPLADTGEIFARAAGDNGIDPRGSPAISNTESSKGYNCFASHNAGGGGSSSGGSWEEAINSHVAGLAESYGYTITTEAARKYCPPNSTYWYSATLQQMQII